MDKNTFFKQKASYFLLEGKVKILSSVAFDFSLVYPDHPILAKETSEDYRATLLIISTNFYNELRPRLTYGNSLFQRQCGRLPKEIQGATLWLTRWQESYCLLAGKVNVLSTVALEVKM